MHIKEKDNTETYVIEDKAILLLKDNKKVKVWVPAITVHDTPYTHYISGEFRVIDNCKVTPNEILLYQYPSLYYKEGIIRLDRVDILGYNYRRKDGWYYHFNAAMMHSTIRKEL